MAMPEKAVALVGAVGIHALRMRLSGSRGSRASRKVYLRVRATLVRGRKATR